jgi:hypothetical protein
MNTDKEKSLSPAALACVLTVFAITGCQTDGSDPAAVRGSVKSQGVYTTRDIPDLGLDLPASGYTQRGSFGPGETPAAVIVGYGSYNQPQSVTLELIESSSGRTLFWHDYYASYGKVVMQPLAIRLSGTYELKLSSGGSPLDTFSFTVTRTNQFGPRDPGSARAGAKYSGGVFAVSVDLNSLPDYFAEYADKLNYWIANAASQKAGSTNAYLFAQRFPGKVVIQCRLDYRGRIIEPKILENSLDDQCGDAMVKALMERSPYGPWPEDVRRKLGADEREIKLTIYLE